MTSTSPKPQSFTSMYKKRNQLKKTTKKLKQIQKQSSGWISKWCCVFSKQDQARKRLGQRINFLA